MEGLVSYERMGPTIVPIFSIRGCMPTRSVGTING